MCKENLPIYTRQLMNGLLFSLNIHQRRLTYFDTVEGGKKVIGGLGFAWCRSGTDWLTPPRGFSRLACDQGSDPAFHQLNRSPR